MEHRLALPGVNENSRIYKRCQLLNLRIRYSFKAISLAGLVYHVHQVDTKGRFVLIIDFTSTKMRFNILAAAGLLLSTVAFAAPVDLSARSDEVQGDFGFEREPDNRPSKIPPYGGAAGIPRPRAPTPDSLRHPRNRPPISPPGAPPRTPSARRALRQSRIPMRGSNMRKRSEEPEDDFFAREPGDHYCRTCIRRPKPHPR